MTKQSGLNGNSTATTFAMTISDASALRGAKVDIKQAMAYAAAHGLDIYGE